MFLPSLQLTARLNIPLIPLTDVSQLMISDHDVRLLYPNMYLILLSAIYCPKFI